MPAAAPGSVSERMAMAIMMTNSNGIMTFENFSMPFFTPKITIKPVTARKIVWQISGPAVEVEKSVNIVAISAE